MYLLLKRGLYWRPNSSGYTGIKDHAGRYSEEEAKARVSEETTMIEESEAPNYSEACFSDLRDAHQIEKLRAALDDCAQWMWPREKMIPGLERLSDRARRVLSETETPST